MPHIYIANNICLGESHVQQVMSVWHFKAALQFLTLLNLRSRAYARGWG